MDVDLLVRNVNLIDGTGAEAREVDVAITADRVRGIEPAGHKRFGHVGSEIDARGLTMAPGFIDVHSHDDGALIRYPDMGFKSSQGCTSVVIGNCGFSATPAQPGAADTSGLIGVTPDWSDLAGYSRQVERQGVAVNAVALVGHNTIRSLVMADQRKDPTPRELTAMKGLVEVAMNQGACGFSTGLVYEPGRYSGTDEVVELAAVAAHYGGIYATHMRNEADRLLDAVAETIEIANRADVTVQVSHHKAAGATNWGTVGRSLALIDDANRRGLDISLDVYPYTAGSGPMAQYFDHDHPDETLASVTRIARCRAMPAYEGQMVADLAAAAGMTPGQIVSQILKAPYGTETICIQFHIDEADVETNMVHDRTMIGSDGIPDLDGRPHPRLFGTFPRFLARYVRQRKLMGLPEAVRRITSLPARQFGLTDRGLVAEGYFADLVLFDPSQIQDQASYDEPTKPSTGVELVVVNGQPIWEQGRWTGALPGRVVAYRS